MIHQLKTAALAALITTCALPASAAIVHIDFGDASIGNDFEGLYINGATGDTTSAFPDDFYDAPWLNVYLGGLGISNSDHLRPWTNQAADYNGSTAGHYFANVSFGSTIGASGVIDPLDGALVGSFVGGESASEYHIGAGSNQFQSLVSGYLAFEYDLSGGGVGYGWVRFAPNTGGSGSLMEMAFSTTAGESLVAGAVPEPATYAALAGVAALGIAALRRRRAAA